MNAGYDLLRLRLPTYSCIIYYQNVAAGVSVDDTNVV